MGLLTRFKFYLWMFGHFKAPLIGYLRPKLITINDKDIVLMIPFRRRSRNHLHSMYFGALSVGADVAGGLHGFYHTYNCKQQVSLVFKSYQAQFIKRAYSDVYFVSTMGDTVKEMIEEAKNTKTRVNRPINIKAYTHYFSHPEPIADFILELSIKIN